MDMSQAPSTTPTSILRATMLLLMGGKGGTNQHKRLASLAQVLDDEERLADFSLFEPLFSLRGKTCRAMRSIFESFPEMSD